MKILHVITSLEIGGAQRLLSDLLPIQKQQGIDVSLLVSIKLDNEFSRKIEDANIHIYSLNEPKIYSLNNILKLRKIFKKYDIVHVHLFPSLYFAAIASIGLNIKLLYTEHSTSNRRRGKFYLRPVEKFMYKQYDKIISISQQTQDALQKWLHFSDERFIVINNGVNVIKFSSIQRPIIPKSLIMVSRFTESKDQETVIRAMKMLDSNTILRLVGDGENLDHCKKIAINEGVADNIQFLGSRSDIVELIAESYIGIQSSNWEGFGLTAVEIMAAGKPVIASDVDGLKQVVENAGEIFHRGNIYELSKLINHLQEDKSYYDYVAGKCKTRASLYDISVMAEKYKNIYYELAKS